MKGPFRRTLVVAGVVFSLLFGAVSIEAAAAWARASAPASAPAITVEALQTQLEAERARSTALLDQLTAIRSQSGELAAGLAAAQLRIAGDLTAAEGLRGELAAAKKQLAALKQQMAAARAAAARVAASRPVATSRPAEGGGEVEDGD